jgi:hypothetical protein
MKKLSGTNPENPVVCWLYPFDSWLKSDIKGRSAVLQTMLQETSDCCGFYVSKSLDDVILHKNIQESLQLEANC